jgi:radical SAM protein with 4Fe4S-binding SPASM domain
MENALVTAVRNIIQQRKISSLSSVENSKAFCIKPWMHLFVSHFGTVGPCCLAPWEEEQTFGNINEQSIDQIWNGQKMREFRIKMLKDQQDSRCWQCYENEKMGLRSTRNVTNFMFADKLDWVINTHLDGFSAQSKPITWDIRISNLCNFKCRICGHHSSSQWYEDAKALGLVSHETKLHRGPKDFDLLMRQLDFVIDDLEEIYFAGGEPLIMEEHYRILEVLLERKKTNVRLSYATNFSQTYFKNKDLFELWARFEDVNVYASLDGSGSRGEIQRCGQRWPQVVENRKRMMRVCPNVDFLITPTINVMNVYHLPDFHREWTEQGLISIDEFMPHILKNPPQLNICILPGEMKAQVASKIEKHIDWIKEYASKNQIKEVSAKKFEKVKERLDWIKVEPVTGNLKLDMVINEFQNCITYMYSRDDSSLLGQFKETCQKLDTLRNENTIATFPELGPIWNNTNR